MSTLGPHIVIDCGSGLTKAGFASSSKPQCMFPSMLGGLKDTQGGCYIGRDAYDRRETLVTRYPVRRGVVRNWDDMERLLEHVFLTELKAQPTNHPVIMAEPCLNPEANREGFMQLLFETFNVPATYIFIQGVAALYASGRTTGLVVEIGEDITQVLSITSGYAKPNACSRVDFGGGDITTWMAALLDESGLGSGSLLSDRERIRELKEQFGYIALSQKSKKRLRHTRADPNNVRYRLPDGREITLGSELYCCAEALFQPNLAGIQSEGLTAMIHNMINLWDSSHHKKLYGNIVLSGGTSMFSGLSKRLKKDLRAKTPTPIRIKVHAASGREYAVWSGAAAVSSLENFQPFLITKKEYEETGSSIVFRKCF
ncbi:unnamed protein product [Schistocephalus solidus]|uniref:Actin n=1 Tax=Schistocephalus solidus TaxID=70667 RepID=A0A183TJR3_SCHSO|nr:unnamed protein product [Schistocephalus solidus]